MAIREKYSGMTNAHSAYDFLNNLPLFANLPNDMVQRFAHAAQIKPYKKGQYLFREGEEAQYFYVLCSGWLKLQHVTEAGEEMVIAMLTKNNMTGESALFEQGKFASNAQVVEDAHIMMIPITLLKEEMQASAALAFNMLTVMVQYQRKHEMQIEQFLLYSAPQRVGCFILGLCPVQEQIDGVEIELPYDKTLIASTLGMKGPTFSRALNMLRDETGTRISGARVTIDSMQRLLKFVDGCYLPHHPPV